MTVKATLAAGILPIRDDGRCLLLLRRTGTWDPPGGRIAPGESFETGAVREVYEETGMLVPPQRILASWVGKRPGGGPLASVTFIGRAPAKAPRLSVEHTNYRWVTLQEWLKLPTWWSRRDIERAAQAIRTLPSGIAHPPPPPKPAAGFTEANLGSGMVIINPQRRALLLRRRKPPVGLWENPGGMLEEGEDFEACARRETLEETGLDLEPQRAWFARVDRWRHPEDPELYAGVAFLALSSSSGIRLEDNAHDAYTWATKEEWHRLPSWYTKEELDTLWATVEELYE